MNYFDLQNITMGIYFLIGIKNIRRGLEPNADNVKIVELDNQRKRDILQITLHRAER